jgi:hypothetical protein
MSKKGRPVLEGSARQARLAAQAERVAANGGVVKRGRPTKAKEAVATETEAPETEVAVAQETETAA